MVIPGWLKRIITYRAHLFLFLYPVLSCPLVIIHDRPKAKCADAVLLVPGYWKTEAIPICVTTLVPRVMAP